MQIERLKFDEKQAEGPIENRVCTDPICAIIFLVFLVGFAACAAWGWINGDPNRLLIGWDSDQNGCGFSEATKDYPYLYFP